MTEDELPAADAGCAVDIYGTQLYNRFGDAIALRQCTLAALLDELMRARGAAVQRALLNDRDARRDSLASLSIVAVLLATAAYAAFAMPPSPPLAWQGIDGGSAAATSAAPTADNAMTNGGGSSPSDVVTSGSGATMWLRAFYRSSLVAFSFAMFAALLVLLKSLPRMPLEDDSTEAGRVWLGLMCLSACLGVAVISGSMAFFLAGVSVYPQQWVRDDMLVPCLAMGVLLTLAVGHGAHAFVVTCPGWASVRAGGASFLPIWARPRRWQGRSLRVKVPVPGADESTQLLVDEVRIVKTNAGRALDHVGCKWQSTNIATHICNQQSFVPGVVAAMAMCCEFELLWQTSMNVNVMQ